MAPCANSKSVNGEKEKGPCSALCWLTLAHLQVVGRYRSSRGVPSRRFLPRRGNKRDNALGRRSYSGIVTRVPIIGPPEIDTVGGFRNKRKPFPNRETPRSIYLRAAGTAFFTLEMLVLLRPFFFNKINWNI